MLSEDASESMANTKTAALTNGELLATLDPVSSSYSLPYIYSNFEWSHCDIVGYTFPVAVATSRRR